MTETVFTHKTNAILPFLSFCAFLLFKNIAKTNEILTFWGIPYMAETAFTHKTNAFLPFLGFGVVLLFKNIAKTNEILTF